MRVDFSVSTGAVRVPGDAADPAAAAARRPAGAGAGELRSGRIPRPVARTRPGCRPGAADGNRRGCLAAGNPAPAARVGPDPVQARNLARSPILAGLVFLLVALGSVGGYLWLGAPASRTSRSPRAPRPAANAAPASVPTWRKRRRSWKQSCVRTRRMRRDGFCAGAAWRR